MGKRTVFVLTIVVFFMAGNTSAELLARWTFDCGYANVGGSVGAAADGTPVGGATIVFDPGYSGMP